MIKVGDIVSIRVKVSSITEEEGNLYKYKVKALSSTGGYGESMMILGEDVIGTTLNVPKEAEEV